MDGQTADVWTQRRGKWQGSPHLVPTEVPHVSPSGHGKRKAQAQKVPNSGLQPAALDQPDLSSPPGATLRPAGTSTLRARPHCAPCARSGCSSAGEGAVSPARRFPPGTQVSLRRFDFSGEPGSPRLRRGGGWQARAAPRDPRRSGHSHRAGVTPASPSHRAAGACFSVRVVRCHRQAVPPGRTVSSLKTRFVTL